MDTPIRHITPVKTINATVSLPPSKSYTNRALITAALAEGSSTLRNPSLSDDSRYMVAALQQLGVAIRCTDEAFEVEGTDGRLNPAGANTPATEINVGNAGTAMRFLAGLTGLVKGDTVLTGDEQMQKRPIGDLLDALKAAGVKSSSNNGFPPVTIHGGTYAGGPLTLKAAVSSQFVSAILLSAPYAKHPVNLHVSGKMSSLPYIDMTLHVMRAFGGKVDYIEPANYYVYNDERYIGQEYTVEGDASSATYFCAAAAITGGTVRIANLSADSLQGDIRFLEVLEQMGCRIQRHDDSIEAHGGPLLGIDVDMNEMPDCVPTLAVIAAFADGPTTILNIEHLKYKETNRLKAIAVELSRLGTKVELYDDTLVVHPRPMHGAGIETYNDHRIAMSFAIAGLRVPGVEITNPSCVAKSFPSFWEEFDKLQKAGP